MKNFRCASEFFFSPYYFLVNNLSEIQQHMQNNNSLRIRKIEGQRIHNKIILHWPIIGGESQGTLSNFVTRPNTYVYLYIDSVRTKLVRSWFHRNIFHLPPALVRFQFISSFITLLLNPTSHYSCLLLFYFLCLCSCYFMVCITPSITTYRPAQRLMLPHGSFPLTLSEIRIRLQRRLQQTSPISKGITLQHF